MQDESKLTVGLMREEVVGRATCVLPSDTVMVDGCSIDLLFMRSNMPKSCTST